MKEIDFYSGFESYPRMVFVQKNQKGEIVKILYSWKGFFNSIMVLIEPDENKGWEGVTYAYHVSRYNWYDAPWKCEDLLLFLHQLNSVETVDLDEREINVLNALKNMVSECIELELDLFLEED